MRWALEWRLKELRRRLPGWLQAALKPLLPRGVEHAEPVAETAAPAAVPLGGGSNAAVNAAVILCYHRIARADDDPYELGVRPERFAAQLAWLREHGRIVPLDEIVRRGRGVRFAITFDDGYADNLHAALPLLEAHAAPATVFVASGYVGGKREFWGDEVRQLVLDPPLERNELTVAGTRVHGDTPRELFLAVNEALRPLPAPRIAAAIAELAEVVGRRVTVREDYRPLTEDELRRLAASELVTIGAHTVDHPELSAHPADAQRQQLEDGRARLEALVGTSVDTLAYPYGDYDATTVRLTRAAGYRLACTVLPGRVSTLLSPRLMLPRVLVRDWASDELARTLSVWLTR